jgi:hypothetical protein
MTDLTAKHPARLMFTDDEGNDHDLSHFTLRNAVVEAARALPHGFWTEELADAVKRLRRAVKALERAEGEE